MLTTQQVLTTTIIAGWLLHVVALGKWSGLGYVQGFIGGEHVRLASTYTSSNLCHGGR